MYKREFTFIKPVSTTSNRVCCIECTVNYIYNFYLTCDSYTLDTYLCFDKVLSDVSFTTHNVKYCILGGDMTLLRAYKADGVDPMNE